MTTIAVIEDDLPIGNLLEEVLEQQGYCLLYTSSARPSIWRRNGSALPNTVSSKRTAPAKLISRANSLLLFCTKAAKNTPHKATIPMPKNSMATGRK